MSIEPNGLAELFLKYDYAETKDLAKSFLTLSSSVLVFSIAFAEKIVEFRTAPVTAKWCLIGAWAINISSIIFCGLAICFLSIAAGEAVYGGDFPGNANMAYGFLLATGVSFVTALFMLLTAAAISLAHRNAEPPPEDG